FAHPRRADRGADEPFLADRRVDDPVVAELLPEPLRDAERAAEVPDVLADQKHAPVVDDRVPERCANRLEVGGAHTAGVSSESFERSSTTRSSASSGRSTSQS